MASRVASPCLPAALAAAVAAFGTLTLSRVAGPALELAKAGASVVAADLDGEQLEVLAAEAVAAGAPERRAASRMEPPSTRPAIPCLTAFSTSG